MNDTRTAAEFTVVGAVQGVGFRDYTRRRADDLGLSGYVMNLRDGRVRVHAEGPREAVELLAKDLERGPRLARVDRVEVTWRPAGDLAGPFIVREQGW